MHLIINKNLFHSLLSLVFFFTIALPSAFAEVPEKTPLEASNFTELPKTQAISAFLAQLAESSSYASLENLGYSAGNRPIDALLLSKDVEFLMNGVSGSAKLTVVLIGSQHGDEPSGSEALQLIAKKILKGDLLQVLDDMNLVLVPNANPDGRDNNERLDESGGNLNRDYTTLLLDETLIFVDAIHEFQPNVILDVHEASEYKEILTGEEGYVLNAETRFEVGNNPNIDARLRDFSDNVFLVSLIEASLDEGLSAVRYMGSINELNQVVSRGGIRATNFRNYSGLQASLSVLVENRLDLPDGDYPTEGNIKARVEKQTLSIEVFLQQIRRYRDQILELTQQARNSWTSDDQGDKTLMLQADFVLNDDEPVETFELIEVDTGNLVEKSFANHDKIQGSIPFELPDAYVVRAEHESMAELLKRHHIHYEVIDKPVQLSGTRQRINNIRIKPPVSASVQLLYVEFDETDVLLDVKEGDLLIKTDQPLGILIPIVFDPRSSSSIFQDAAYRSLLLKYEDFFIVPVTMTTDADE